ncbi:MAG: hypothetical protein GXY43_02860 [Clostridiaceae bacterium]|nr:hypothetical protein [Clostridiaceae bacterium]
MSYAVSVDRSCTVRSFPPSVFPFIRITLESEDLIADIRADRRTEEILRMILRELICFRRERSVTRDCPYEISMSDPFLEWFGLILGNVYTDRSVMTDGRIGSDLNYSFALRILNVISSDSSGTVSGATELDLLLPPLWKLGLSIESPRSSTEAYRLSRPKERHFPSEQKDRHTVIREADPKSDGFGLCLLRMCPSGSFRGTMLKNSETTGFYPVVPVPSESYAKCEKASENSR